MKKHLHSTTVFILMVLSMLLVSYCSCQSYTDVIRKADAASSVDTKLTFIEEAISSGHWQDHPDTMAMFYYEKSRALFRGSVSIAESINALDQGLDLINEVDHRDLWIKLWYYKGYWYRKWDKYEEAKKSLTRALKYTDDNPYEWDATIQLGKTFKDRGEFSIALDYYDRAIELAGDDKARLSTSYEVISFVYLIMETKEGAEKALPWLDRLITLLNTMEGEGHFTASMTFNKGCAYMTLEDHKNAALYFDRSERLIDACCPGDNSFKSLLYESRASLLSEEGRYDDAIKYYQKSLSLYEHSFDLTRSDGLATTYHLIAEAYEQKGDLAQALSYISKALSYRVSGIESGAEEVPITTVALHENGEKHYLIDDLLLKAKILLSLHEQDALAIYLKQAEQILSYADVVVDHMRFEQLEESTKEFWRTKTSDVYDLMVKVHYDLNQNKEAFYYAEKAKYLLMGEHLVNQQEGRKSSDRRVENLSSELLNIRRKIQINKEEVIVLERSEETSGQDSLKFLLVDLRKQEDDLISKIKEISPTKYFDQFSFNIAGIPEVQTQLLQKDQTLVEYYLDDRDLYIFVVGAQTYEVRKVHLSFDLLAKLEEMRATISHEARNAPEYLDRYATLAHDIYKVTIGEVSDLLTDDLLIVADGVLSLIPFSILLSEESSIDEKRLSDWPYLLRSYNLSYLKSASLGLFQFNNVPSRDYDEEVLAFSPSFEDASNMTLADGTEGVRNSLAPLSGTVAEISFVKEKLNGVFFDSENATEDNFKKALSKSYSIFHLASHALVDDEDPDFSKLILDNNSVTEDGDLHAYEIANLPIRSDLVILSACNTGYGQIQKGEGINSLGKSFAQAGSPNLLMSLWPVSDRATSTLIKEYYNHLLSGTSKRSALTDAKLSFLSSVPAAYHHPYYWGGFVYYGDDQPLQIAPAKSVNTPVLLTLGFAFISLVLLGRSRKFI